MLLRFRKFAYIVLLLGVSLCACQPDNPARQLPGEAKMAAFSSWPVADYPNMDIGPTSKQLAFKSSSKLYDRWCIEVIYSEPNSPTVQRHAAVIIEQIKADPSGLGAWAYLEPLRNSNCDKFN